jgi:uncharacterized protein
MKTLLTFLWLALALTVRAAEFPEPMRPPRLVNDLTKMFTPQQANALERKLRHFNDTSSTQIAVATVPSLHGYAPNDYAQRLAEKWGIGQQGKDNGILILLKPKTLTEQGQVAIAVGYGLEGVIPDAIASRIIRNEIIPAFQQGNYYRGIDRATDVLMQLAGGEFTAEQYANSGPNPLWIMLPFFLLLLVSIFARRRHGYTTDSHGTHGGGLFPFIFFGGLGGGRGSGFGSFSSGSGSFGGFGGGGFGGGGASGSW